MNRAFVFFVLFISTLFVGCINLNYPKGDITPPTGLSVDYRKQHTEENFFTLKWFLIPDAESAIAVNSLYDGVNIYFVKDGENGVTDEDTAYEYFLKEWVLQLDDDPSTNSEAILNKPSPSVESTGSYNTSGSELKLRIMAEDLGIAPVGDQDPVFSIGGDDKYYLVMTTVGEWDEIYLESSLSEIILFDYAEAEINATAP